MLLSSELPFSLDNAIRSFESHNAGHENRASIQLVDFLPASDHPQFNETLVELIRVDLELGWADRHPKSLEEYLLQFPVLRLQPESMSLICFEEFRQRMLAGEDIGASFYRDRYGLDVEGWKQETSSHRSSRSAHQDVCDRHDGMPVVGDVLLDFELVGELGRGSFARVFLARQLTLSDRPVALKVTRNRFSDASTLARLQHTNIIPIYSVQRYCDWEAICMPYLGAVTVRHLLGLMQNQKSMPPSAKFIFDTVRDDRERTIRSVLDPMEFPEVGFHSQAQDNLSLVSRLQTLSGMPYVEFVMVMAKKIVAALAYAHERGIIHRDLKPANILIADDGEPLILDFNLSQDESLDSIDRQQLVGGTLPYMAPEQLAAIDQQSSCKGDPRSDLYSFGIILYELFVGQPPFPIRSGAVHEVVKLSLADRHQFPVSLSRQSLSIAPGIRSILQKCLAFKLEDRYQSANELFDDLHCQLNDLPLRFAPNCSLKERGQKWMRRHPKVVSASGILAMAAGALIVLGTILAVRSDRLASFEAQSLWLSFQQRLRNAEQQLIHSTLADVADVNESLASCDRALSVFGVETDQAWLTSSSVARLDHPQRQQLAQDVAELYFLKATSLGLKAESLSTDNERAPVLLAAAKCNRQAHALVADVYFGNTLERQLRWLQNDSTAVEPRMLQADFEKMPVQVLCERACLLSAQRRFREATLWWDAAAMRDPQNIWVWYGLGYALKQTQKFPRAAECYSVCISLDPSGFQWYFDRGVIRLQTGDYQLAATDLIHASKLNPTDAEAHLNLSIAHVELRNHSLACQSLAQSLANGLKDPQTYLLIARAKAALGEAEAAKQAIALAIECKPMRAASWVSRGVARAQADPQAAIRDFDEAIKLNAFTNEAYESKASVYAEILHDPQTAIAVLDEAVRRFPESGEFRAIRGVLHARLQHKEEAIIDATDALAISSSPDVGYCVAGIYANLSRSNKGYQKKATDLLASSLKAGYGSELLDADSDLSAIRESSEFKQIRSAAQVLQSFSSE